MSDNMHNPLEAVPRIQDLYTDPSEPALLDRLIAETDDNRRINLHNMGFRSPERASVRFVMCTQVEGYDAAVSKLVEDVDYLLIDSPYTGNEAGRRVHDVALMAGFCDTRLYAEPPRGDEPAWSGFHRVAPSPGARDPIVQRFVDSSHYKEREEKPIIRTIGLGAEDRLPSGTTVGESREFAGALATDFNTKLFTSLNGQLLGRLKGIVECSVPELKAVDGQLRADISTMIGNAIVRSAWDKQLKFGVVLDARYEAVASEIDGIFRRSGILSEILYEPFFSVDSATFLPSALDRAEREMANDPNNSIKPATLERVLLGRYMEETFLEHTDSNQEIERAVRLLDYELSDEEVSAFLHEIEGAKRARISSVDLRRRSVAERRRNKVNKIIWSPHVVDLGGTGPSTALDQSAKTRVLTRNHLKIRPSSSKWLK